MFARGIMIKKLSIFLASLIGVTVDVDNCHTSRVLNSDPTSKLISSKDVFSLVLGERNDQLVNSIYLQPQKLSFDQQALSSTIQPMIHPMMIMMNRLSFTAVPDNYTSCFVDGNNASELSTCIISDLKACVQILFYYFSYCHYSRRTGQVTPRQQLRYKMMVFRKMHLPNSTLNHFRKSCCLSKYDLTYLEDKWDQLEKDEERSSKFQKRMFRCLFHKICSEDLKDEDVRNDFGTERDMCIIKAVLFSILSHCEY